MSSSVGLGVLGPHQLAGHLLALAFKLGNGSHHVAVFTVTVAVAVTG